MTIDLDLTDLPVLTPRERHAKLIEYAAWARARALTAGADKTIIEAAGLRAFAKGCSMRALVLEGFYPSLRAPISTSG
jgi:hypothetical protein